MRWNNNSSSVIFLRLIIFIAWLFMIQLIRLKNKLIASEKKTSLFKLFKSVMEIPIQLQEIYFPF